MRMTSNLKETNGLYNNSSWTWSLALALDLVVTRRCGPGPGLPLSWSCPGHGAGPPGWVKAVADSVLGLLW